MQGYAPVEDIGLLYSDINACFLALVNALEAKRVLSKSEIAAAAQERLLVLQEPGSRVDASRLLLLRSLATAYEGIGLD